MQLSRRLEAVSRMVTPGNRLVDVGTDHGYVPIHLVLSRVIPSAIAMDINEGPLLRAKRHIASCGLDAYIETRRSDGLQSLAAGEGDTLLIAGMGGALICRILEDGSGVLDGFSELILAPQSDPDWVRGLLVTKGFVIDREDFVSEDGKYYPIIHAVPGRTGEPLSGAELYYGPCLLAARHPVLREYLEKERRTMEGIQSGLAGLTSEKAFARRNEVEEKLGVIHQALSCYEP